MTARNIVDTLISQPCVMMILLKEVLLPANNSKPGALLQKLAISYPVHPLALQMRAMFAAVAFLQKAIQNDMRLFGPALGLSESRAF